MVSLDGWKYVWRHEDRDGLYDLDVDPHEMENLADDEARADRRDALAGELERLGERYDDPFLGDYAPEGRSAGE